MKKRCFWTCIIISLIPLQLVLAIEPNQKQKLSFEKKHKKIEHRIEKNEGRKNSYFSKKRALLNKKYYVKLQRLEKKKNKISQKKYTKDYLHLQKWFNRELRQLAYQEEKFKKKIIRHREQLDRLQ